jgi:hypothetical protein
VLHDKLLNSGRYLFWMLVHITLYYRYVKLVIIHVMLLLPGCSRVKGSSFFLRCFDATLSSLCLDELAVCVTFGWEGFLNLTKICLFIAIGLLQVCSPMHSSSLCLRVFQAPAGDPFRVGRCRSAPFPPLCHWKPAAAPRGNCCTAASAHCGSQASLHCSN